MKSALRSATVPCVLAASLLVSLLVLVLGATSAYAVGGISVDQSVNAYGATSFTIGTTQPDELILIAADGWPCSGQTVTVDGSAATLVTTAGCSYETGEATVFEFVAASLGIHDVAVDEGSSNELSLNFGVSLLNATATGLTSAAFTGGSPSITTTAAGEYVFATSEYNTGLEPGTLVWSGSPVTPTFLQGGGTCDPFCGIDASIAGLGAPTAGTYSAGMSDSNQLPGSPGLTILVAVEPKSPCGTALSPYFLTATYATGTFTGLFCVNAAGTGTYTQYSVPAGTQTATGTGTVKVVGRTTAIAASGTGLALLGELTASSSTFTETAPAPMKTGTFTLATLP
jgi:hypothetical protein